MFEYPVSDYLYFGGNGILQIGFFVYMLRYKNYFPLVCAGLFYSITNFVIETLMLIGIGDVKTWIYSVILITSMLVGYLYGKGHKNG